MSSMFSGKYPFSKSDLTTIEESIPSPLKAVFSKSSTQSKPSRYFFIVTQLGSSAVGIKVD